MNIELPGVSPEQINNVIAIELIAHLQDQFQTKLNSEYVSITSLQQLITGSPYFLFDGDVFPKERLHFSKGTKIPPAEFLDPSLIDRFKAYLKSLDSIDDETNYIKAYLSNAIGSTEFFQDLDTLLPKVFKRPLKHLHNMSAALPIDLWVDDQPTMLALKAELDAKHHKAIHFIKKRQLHDILTSE